MDKTTKIFGLGVLCVVLIAFSLHFTSRPPIWNGAPERSNQSIFNVWPPDVNFTVVCVENGSNMTATPIGRWVYELNLSKDVYQPLVKEGYDKCWITGPFKVNIQ